MKQIQVYSNYFQIKQSEEISKYNFVIEGGNVNESFKEIR